jgi:hypothetical protein
MCDISKKGIQILIFPFPSYYVWPPLWSSGQSFSLQMQMSGFDPQRYQIVWEVVGLEGGSLSLVSTTEQLTEW